MNKKIMVSTIVVLLVAFSILIAVSGDDDDGDDAAYASDEVQEAVIENEDSDLADQIDQNDKEDKEDEKDQEIEEDEEVREHSAVDIGAFPLPVIAGERNTVVDEAELESASEFIREAFNETVDVKIDYDLESFVITPFDESFADEVLLAMEGDPDYLNTWEFFVGGMIALSETVSGMGADYGILIVNPTNPENALLVIHQGNVLYNVLE